MYLARDSRLARKVALKVLRPELADPDWIAAFRHEALAASALNHPNIVTIYEIGEHEGTRFIAAEYVDGITLRERLKKGPIPRRAGRYRAPDRRRLGGGARSGRGAPRHQARQRDAARRRSGEDSRLRHRHEDRLRPSPRCRRIHANPKRAVIGTTGYMSPEQRHGLPVDARTDVWSLGIVMYEMATGHLPARWQTRIRSAALRTQSTPALDELDAHSAGARADRQSRSLASSRRIATRRLENWRTICVCCFARSTTHPETSPAVAPGRRRARALSRLGAAALILVTVTTYLVVVAGRSREMAAITSIGVLPLQNAAETRGGEYLADGIASSLRSRLAQFSSIRQAAASEAARYERLGASPAQAGREMHVAAVLTGALERRADSVRVRLELVRSADGAELWKRQFVRPIDDVLTLQTEIARELVEELGISPRPVRGRQ